MRITLKAARINSGYTQREVAETIMKRDPSVKLNWQRIAYYERYPDRLELSVAQYLADIYHLSLEELIFSPEDKQAH